MVGERGLQTGNGCEIRIFSCECEICLLGAGSGTCRGFCVVGEVPLGVCGALVTSKVVLVVVR